jgi:hypothetical protein
MTYEDRETEVAAKACLSPHLKKIASKMDSSSNSNSYAYGGFTSYLKTIYFADYLMNKVEESNIQRVITLLKKIVLG